jgi:hypothetical protein
MIADGGGMKKQTVIMITLVAFVIGSLAGYIAGERRGFGESTRIWSRLSEEQTVSTTLADFVRVYPALKLLRDGQTERATHLLQSQLQNGLDGVDLISQTLYRPDKLTNSVVIHARAF